MEKHSSTTIDRPFALVGDKIGLRVLHKDDVPTMTPWFSDLDFVMSLTARGLPQSEANEQEWFDQHAKNTESSVQLGIWELATDRHVGNCGLFAFTRHNTAVFGIGIGDRNSRGKGYGTEATRLMAEYGFYFMNLYNIHLEVYSFNAAAIRAYLSAGYKEVGRIRGAICVAGSRYDRVVMDIVRDDVDLSRMRAMTPALDRSSAAVPADGTR